jgi:hypothetical protein
MSSLKLKRADFMSHYQKSQIDPAHPRTHTYCLEKCDVARPGKTAHDRARRAK